MNNRFFHTLIIMLGMLLVSCSVEEPNLSDDLGPLPLSCEVPSIESYGRYYTLNISTSESGVKITSSSDWITVCADTVPVDGIVDIYIADNIEVNSRTGLITFESLNTPEKRTHIEITQKGLGDYDDNDDSSPLSDFRVGWGFNAFDEYQSIKSVKGKIIDLAKLNGYDSDETFQSVQEVVRSSEEFDIISAYSMHELSTKLTKKMDSKFSFLGLKKTVERFERVCNSDLNESYLAYARLNRIVASRSIDRGAIEFIVSSAPTEKLPFTSAFMTVYKTILESSGAERDKAISAMLSSFGTHVVVESSVGGAIDYAVTFNRHQVASLKETSENVCSSIFGFKIHSEKSSYDSVVNSYPSNHYSITIAGGEANVKKQFLEKIGKMEKGDELPENLFQDWVKSINYSPECRKNLDVVDFIFLPVWNLFKDAEVSNRVQSMVVELSQQSNNSFTDVQLGTDNYIFDLSSSQYKFDNLNSSTLVKVVYNNNVPVLEICQEYVPQIRSDRRITVYYPIRNGRTNILQGIFPGDGEGNRPAQLSFSGGSVYVNPVDGYGYFDKVTKLYYVHGNLYTSDMGVGCKQVSKSSVKEHWMQLNGSDRKYGVVKIGSGYWTRENIKEELYFGTTENRRFKQREIIVNGILYASIFGNQSLFLKTQSGIFGPDIESDTGKATCWYIPHTSDKEALMKYIGNNCKMLFKGQASGFDAQFVGYYKTGSSGTQDSGNAYIAFQGNTAQQTGEALVLTPNYTWSTNVISGLNHRFPIKLFRTPYFQYK